MSVSHEKTLEKTAAAHPPTRRLKTGPLANARICAARRCDQGCPVWPCFWCVEIARKYQTNIVEHEIFIDGTLPNRHNLWILYCSNTKTNDKHVATIIFASLCAMNSMKVHIMNWTRIHPPRIRTAYLRSHPPAFRKKKKTPASSWRRSAASPSVPHFWFGASVLYSKVSR